MSTRILQTVGLALCMLCFVVNVEAQTTLVWKFKPGEKLTYTNTSEMKQVMKVAEQNVTTSMSQGMELTWNVKNVQDGKADVVQRIEQFRQKVESPFGANFEFDSKTGKKPEGPEAKKLQPLFDAMVGAEFSFKMDPYGETSDAKISDKLIQAMKENPTLAQMSALFSEEGMKSMMQQTSVSFPKESITKGKSWDKVVEIKLPFGNMKMATTYTYQGPENKNNAKLERIDTQSKISIEPGAGSPISLKIKSADVKGTIYFDNAAGHLVEASQTQKLVMEIAAGNQNVDSTQDQTMTMKLIPAGSATPSK